MSAPETLYIVQTYTRGARGALKIGEAIKCSTEGSARARADKIWALGKVLGVEVVRQTAEPEAGEFGEPEYLVRMGGCQSLA